MKTIFNPFTRKLQKISDTICDLNVSVVTITFSDTPFQIVAATHFRINVDCTDGAVTVTLPSMANVTITGNRIFHIKKVDSSANAVTINESG